LSKEHDHNPFHSLCDIEDRFVAGHIFGRPDTRISTVYIVKEGLLSVTVPLAHGGEVETALIGPGGVAGAMAAFGCSRWFNTVVAQTGGVAWVVDLTKFMSAVRHEYSLQRCSFQHELWISVQAQQTAACNAVHSLPARMSTWLLRAQDLTGSNEFHFTHEYISEMLGAQRVSISNAAIEMRRKGLISYRRGSVAVQDRPGLEREACECYLAMRSAQEEIFRQ
jgi:CRP-like cAMP-binding protein